MTIEYNANKFQYEVKIGSLVYSVHEWKGDAILAMNEYRRLFKIGRV